jgi:hypothetical protein
MIILEIEMEMFFPGHNESTLKSKALKDQGQRQFNKATWIFLIPLVGESFAILAGNKFRNNPAQLLYFTDKKTEAWGYY